MPGIFPPLTPIIRFTLKIRMIFKIAILEEFAFLRRQQFLEGGEIKITFRSFSWHVACMEEKNPEVLISSLI